MSKSSIKIKLVEGNLSQSKKAKKKQAPKNKNIKDMRGILISRVSHPVYVRYGEEEIRLTGRAQVAVADYTLLGELERGIFLKTLAKK